MKISCEQLNGFSFEYEASFLWLCYAASSWGLFSLISCHVTSSSMAAHYDMILHFSGYVALSWGSLFVNFMSHWKQLNGFSFEHVALSCSVFS